MRRKGAFVGLALFAFGSLAVAGEDPGAIVFYRAAGPTNGRYVPLLFCDSIQIGELASGSYLTVPAIAGDHCCAAGANGQPTVITVAPGATTYISVGISSAAKPYPVLSQTDRDTYWSVTSLVALFPFNDLLTNANDTEPSQQASSTPPVDIRYLKGNLKETLPPGVASAPMCLSCPLRAYELPRYTAPSDPRFGGPGLDGTVTFTAAFDFIVQSDGHVNGLSLAKSSGVVELDGQIASQMHAWNLKPALDTAGQAIAVIMRTDVSVSEGIGDRHGLPSP